MAGLTSTGFEKKTLSQIKSEMEQAWKIVFGNQVNLAAGSTNATFIGILSEREASIWDLAEAVYLSQYPNSADGVSLANVGAITNSAPRIASSSFILGQLLFGTPGTEIPVGTIFSVAGNPAARFATADVVTLGTGTDAVQSIGFSSVPDDGTWTLSIGTDDFEFDFDDNAAAIQAAINALEKYEDVTVTGNYTSGFTVTFTGAQGKRPWDLMTVDDSELLDGMAAVTVTVVDTTVGVAQATVRVNAEDTGPISAPTGMLTVIETPVTGLDSTLNLIDATFGTDAETDAEFRLRRISELAQPGASTVPAIEAELKRVTDVNQVIVFENTTLTVDGDGRPPKSIQAYVDGGDTQEIGETLWRAKPGGIETYGEEEVNFTDSQGLEQTVFFSRPTPKNIWVEIDVDKSDDYPVDGDDQIEAAILAYGAGLIIGQDVLVYPKLLPSIVDNVAGINDIEIRIGLASNPTLDDNIEVDPNEIAKFDSARIEVGEL